MRALNAPAKNRKTFTVSIQIYTDRAKQWRWRLVGSNGRILADSGESYTRRYSCTRAVSRVIALVRAMDLNAIQRVT